MSKGVKTVIISATAIIVAAAIAIGVLLGTEAVKKNDKKDESKPTQTENITDKDDGKNIHLSSISANDYHVIAVRNDRTVIATGDNYYGQCNVQDWQNIISVAAGLQHSVGLKADGTVVATNFVEYSGEAAEPYTGQCDVEGWSDIVSVCADGNFTIGLKSDGTVVTAGEYAKKYFSEVKHWKNIIDISCNEHHVVGAKKDGTVVATSPISGEHDYGQSNVTDWSNIIDVSAGVYHTLGVKADGTVVATEIIDDPKHTRTVNMGQIDVEEWTDIVSVSTEVNHSIGLKKDGTVVFAGGTGGTVPQSNDWSDIALIEAGPLMSVGVKSDGSVVVVGNDYAAGIDELKTWTNILISYENIPVGSNPDADVTVPGEVITVHTEQPTVVQGESPTRPVVPPTNPDFATKEEISKLLTLAFGTGNFDRYSPIDQKNAALPIIGLECLYKEFFPEPELISGTPDPLDYLEYEDTGRYDYYCYDGENVDWIIRNVYGVEPNHNLYEGMDWYNGIDTYAYYYDGNYYVPYLATGWGYESLGEYEISRDESGMYSLTVELLDGFEDSFRGYMYIDAELITVDGEKIWSIHRIYKEYQ